MLPNNIKQSKETGAENSVVVQHLNSMPKALGLIPNIAKKKFKKATNY